jgi:hypothetical protein
MFRIFKRGRIKDGRIKNYKLGTCMVVQKKGIDMISFLFKEFLSFIKTFILVTSFNSIIIY